MGDREGSPRLIFTTGIYLEGVGGSSAPSDLCDKFISTDPENRSCM